MNLATDGKDYRSISVLSTEATACFDAEGVLMEPGRYFFVLGCANSFVACPLNYAWHGAAARFALHHVARAAGPHTSIARGVTDLATIFARIGLLGALDVDDAATAQCDGSKGSMLRLRDDVISNGRFLNQGARSACSAPSCALQRT